jgi:hypothetical protein
VAGRVEESRVLPAHLLVVVDRDNDALAAPRIMALALELGALDVEAIGRGSDARVHVSESDSISPMRSSEGAILLL